MTYLHRLPGWFIKFVVIVSLIFFFAFVIFIGYLAAARNTPLQLPAPTGSYPVGRTVFDWSDIARPDPLADKGNSPRELVVWVWYPAATKGVTPAPYLPPVWVQARNKDQGIGILIESNFNKIRTNSSEGIPLAPAPRVFPILVMQPGLGPMATDYTIFAENLASHGYIVVGINPTYSANWTVFPDGRYVPRSIKGTIPDSDSLAAAEIDGSRILDVWVQDAVFVMDQLAKMNGDQASFFSQRLDLEHIGLWGHSFGGATAAAVCQNDPRCKAGINMDGTPFGKEKDAPLEKPFMIITEDYSRGCDRDCELMRQVFLHTKPGAAYSLSITGTRHFNFSDLPFRWTPALKPLFIGVGLGGPINPSRATQITNAYLVAFFDQYLKGTQAGPLDGLSAAYPEVKFEKH